MNFKHFFVFEIILLMLFLAVSAQTNANGVGDEDLLEEEDDEDVSAEKNNTIDAPSHHMNKETTKTTNAVSEELNITSTKSSATPPVTVNTDMFNKNEDDDETPVQEMKYIKLNFNLEFESHSRIDKYKITYGGEEFDLIQSPDINEGKNYKFQKNIEVTLPGNNEILVFAQILNDGLSTTSVPSTTPLTVSPDSNKKSKLTNCQNVTTYKLLSWILGLLLLIILISHAIYFIYPKYHKNINAYELGMSPIENNDLPNSLNKLDVQPLVDISGPSNDINLTTTFKNGDGTIEEAGKRITITIEDTTKDNQLSTNNDVVEVKSEEINNVSLTIE